MSVLYAPKLTYVIPFRFKQDRITHLRRVVELANMFQETETMIIEQDNNSKLLPLNFNAKIIFTENKLPFNKSWGYNIALKNSNAPIVVFSDADFIMPPNLIVEALNALDTVECVIASNNIIKLTQEESFMDTQSIFNIKREGVKTSKTDGMIIMRKSALIKIGGWNEDFVGIGYENMFQDMKIEKMLTYKQMEFTGYHLFHQEENKDINLEERNFKLFEHYKKLDDNQLIQHINHVLPKIGMLNKYK